MRDELMVFYTAQVFNINNIIKMRLFVEKDNIKLDSEIKKLTDQTGASKETYFTVGDPYAPIVEEENKEIIQENIWIYHTNQ